MLSPMLLTDLTVKVYLVPLSKPFTSISFVVPVAVWPPGLAVTIYSVIAGPPLGTGRVKLIIALPSPPAIAVTLVGGLGRGEGVAGTSSVEAPLYNELKARTLTE